jgi:acyl carrier protein
MENFNEIIAEILEVESVEPDNALASFEAWDSLTVLSIIAFCDSDYGVALSAEEVDSAETIAGLKDLIEGKL